MNIDLNPLVLTGRLAVLTAIILFATALPLAFWLWRTRSWLKLPVQALVNMPLVLPPVVIGFYLLVLFSPGNPLGRFIQAVFHTRLVFTFQGLVVGSVIFNLPFMVNPLLAGLEALPRSIVEASYALGKGPWLTLWRVQLPAMRPALLTGLVLTFAHTIGEFGVVLMIGGKIPGVTRVASIAVYDEVEAFNYAAAHFYSGVLVVASFTVLIVLLAMNRRFVRTF
jgi:molybdate transport system permease protein